MPWRELASGEAGGDLVHDEDGLEEVNTGMKRENEAIHVSIGKNMEQEQRPS